MLKRVSKGWRTKRRGKFSHRFVGVEQAKSRLALIIPRNAFPPNQFRWRQRQSYRGVCRPEDSLNAIGIPADSRSNDRSGAGNTAQGVQCKAQGATAAQSSSIQHPDSAWHRVLRSNISSSHRHCGRRTSEIACMTEYSQSYPE